jgi:PAS domain S-box-containing protein
VIVSVHDDAGFRYAVEHAPDGVAIVQRGLIVFINAVGARLLGTDRVAAIGKPIGGFLPPRDAALTAQRIAEMIRTGTEMPPNEYGVLADPDRTVEIKSITCEWQGGPAVLAFARDVTERNAIRHKLIAVDRLTALGKLAAGVAHEINNPLAYVQLSLELMRRQLAELELPAGVGGELVEILGEAEHGVSRVAAITTDLRAFARADHAQAGPVDVAAAIEQSLRMVDNDLRHRARLLRAFADVAPVTGNPSRLEQVFVNLIVNAIHSLRDPARDEIHIAIRPAGTSDVAIVIRDTGCGIPAAIRERIFEQFFTTKPAGEGMGLGLSVCKMIVESFGGRIAVDSVEGTGTTVTVTLPAHQRQVAAIHPAPVPALGRQRILIVDDEPFVRDSLSELLSPDHDVATAAGGELALGRLAGEPFDVVVCDVMMPGMTGVELYRQIATSFPELEPRVMFITGGTLSPELGSFLESVGDRCLPKPFKLEQLVAAIARVTSP